MQNKACTLVWHGYTGTSSKANQQQANRPKDHKMTVLQIEATTSQLENDLAFKYSIANNDVSNLQMVLRAYGLDFTYATAQAIIAHNSH